MICHARRNFDGCVRIRVWAVRDRHYRNKRRTIFSPSHGHHNGTRSILAAFNKAVCCFIAPKVRIGNDKTDLRFGVCHRRYPADRLVVVEDFVEMIVCRIHTGGRDGLGNLVGQVIETVDSALKGPQTL